MLKTKPLTELLSQSISCNVTTSLLFTPSGALLATSASPTSPDAKKARTHAALAANIWTAYDRVAVAGAIEGALSTPPNSIPPEDDDSGGGGGGGGGSGGGGGGGGDHGLTSLTLELSECNIHIQVVAPRVLLCLIGPRQSLRYNSSSSSVHSQDIESRMTPPGSVPRSGCGCGGGGGGAATASSGSTPAAGSLHASGGGQTVSAGGALGILKTQAQALADYLKKELQGFELPEGL